MRPGVTDSLTVQRRGPDPFSEELVDERAGGGAHVVPVQRMVVVVSADQRAAEGDSEDLQAAADAEHRDPGVGGAPDQSDLGVVALAVDVVRRTRRAVARRVDVPASGEYQAVDQVEQVEPCPGRDDHRTRAHVQQRVDVRLRGTGHRKLPERLGHEVAVADDAGDGSGYRDHPQRTGRDHRSHLTARPGR